MNDKTLASVVKEAREKLGISQRELSRRTGIDNNTLAKIEKGERKKPNVLSLRKLALVLDLSLDELMKLANYNRSEFNIISNRILNNDKLDVNSTQRSMIHTFVNALKYDVCARKIMVEFIKKKEYRNYKDYKNLEPAERKKVDKAFDGYLESFMEDVDTLEASIENVNDIS